MNTETPAAIPSAGNGLADGDQVQQSRERIDRVCQVFELEGGTD